MSASNSAGYTPKRYFAPDIAVMEAGELPDGYKRGPYVKEYVPASDYDALAASHGELSQRLKFLDEWLANDDVSSAPMDAKTARLAKAWLRAALAKARPGATP
jgi:hypothetical protein